MSSRQITLRELEEYMQLKAGDRIFVNIGNRKGPQLP